MANRKRQDSRLVIALDLGGTKLASALVTNDGHVQKASSAPTVTSGGRACLDQLLASAQQARQLARGRAAAIGVSVPGLVRRDGTVWAPNIPEWTRMPVAQHLTEATGLPATVESDRNASVLGEAWRGAARGAQDAVYLIIGTGIGAGILSGGRLIRGAHELSGCAGWMVLSADPLGAKLGEKVLGVLETLTAGPAIGAAGAKALKKSKATARDVIAAARRGHAGALRVVRQAGFILGLAVANIISLFDPEVVVLGGGVGASGDVLLIPLRTAALQWAQPLAAKDVRIVPSRLGGRAPLLGAARLAFEHCGLPIVDCQQPPASPQSAIRNKRTDKND